MRPLACPANASSRIVFTFTLALTLLLLLAPSSFGAGSSPDVARFRHPAKDHWMDFGDGARDDRQDGETIATAIVIPSLPFFDTGATCDNVNDYDEACPFSGSTSPDVVYAFTPQSETTLSVDLCASSYDTKVYVYAGDVSQLVACNDDAGCGSTGYESRLWNVTVTPGTTYYIVVDGYGGSCGTYVLEITYPPAPCAICPPDGVAEGEPPCMDDYVDEYNSGCCCVEMNWTPIIPVTAGCATMCGRSCTFLHHGLSYRDTDWFACEAAGGPVTVECQADFPVEMLLFDPANCDSLVFDHFVIGEPCETVQLTHSMPANSTFWIWVGPSQFNGIPERPYLLSVCGIRGSAATIQDPVESGDFKKTTWGRLKEAFGIGHR